MPGRALVLDANISVRAVLGRRVRNIIEAHCETVSFFLSEPAYKEAEEPLHELAIQHRGDAEKALALSHSIASVVDVTGPKIYTQVETQARERLGARDPARTGPLLLLS